MLSATMVVVRPTCIIANIPVSMKVHVSLMLSAAFLLKPCNCRTADLALKSSRHIIQAFCSSLIQPVCFGNSDCTICALQVRGTTGAAATQDGTGFQHFKPHTTFPSLLMLFPRATRALHVQSLFRPRLTTATDFRSKQLLLVWTFSCSSLRPFDQQCQSGRHDHDLVLCL